MTRVIILPNAKKNIKSIMKHIDSLNFKKRFHARLEKLASQLEDNPNSGANPDRSHKLISKGYKYLVIEAKYLAFYVYDALEDVVEIRYVVNCSNISYEDLIDDD